MKKTNKTLGIFGNLYAMVFAALLVAISVTGKVYAINIGTELRISYENLPVILSGIMMGPAVGIVVGVCADLCGCLVMGYSVNPIITLGMASLGLTSGIISMFFKNRFSPVSLIVCDISAHIIGNIILKTIGLAVFFGAKNGFFALMGQRALTCIPMVIFELIVFIAILSNKFTQREINRMLAGGKKPKPAVREGDDKIDVQ